MGIIRKTFLAGTATAAATAAYLGGTTTLERPLPPTDPIFSTKTYKRANRLSNPATTDVVTKRIPLDQIRPELLEKKGELVLELCRGVWSSPGYEFQRRYLANKYQNPSTSTSRDLWSREELAASDYKRGTIVTDHFEVVEKTPTSIVVRCGDSPRNSGPRPSDGLFGFHATIDKERGEAVLGLKSTLFNSAEKQDAKPMPEWMEVLHTWYARLWLATGSRRLLK